MSEQYQKPLSKKPTAVEALGNTNLKGKVAIVTGGNKGLGLETVRALAIGGAKVYMTARDTNQGQQAKEKLQQDKELGGEVVVAQMDLTNFESIHKFSKNFLNHEKRLDLLVCNAGVAFLPQKYTIHDLEFQFGTNHMGHFALTMDLLDMLKKQEFESRIVVVSSLGHILSSVDIKDPNFKKRKYSPGISYGQSKTANILFVKELAIRLKGTKVLAYSLHPGVIETDLGNNAVYFGNKWLDSWASKATVIFVQLFYPKEIKSVAQGAGTTVFACVAKSIENQSGAYLTDCQISKTSRAYCEDMKLARELWELSEKTVQDINKSLESKK